MEEVKLLPSFTISEIDLIQITRLNQRFEPLLNLAKLFLSNNSLQLSVGNLTTFAFVLNMNKLFEAFVISFIQRHRSEILPTELQNCNLLPQAKGTNLYLALTHHNQAVFYLKPDLVFQSNDVFPLILDAKYKQLKLNSQKGGVSEADFYQMYAYSHRYRCPYVILLYPQTADILQPLQIVFTLKDTNQVIVAATVDLRCDLSQPQEREILVARLNNIFGNKYEQAN